MKKVLSALLLIVLFQACTNGMLGGDASKDELVIVNFNDSHARVYEGEGMGFAKVATLVENLKKKYTGENQVMVLDAGDTFHGTSFATLERGESIVNVLNELGLTAMTLGNHDFNYGQERLLELQKLAKFDIVSANITYKADNKKFVQPYVIKNVNGKKVGIFGISTPETMYKTNPLNVKGLIFGNPVQAAIATVEELKVQGVDYIILLSHLGLYASTAEELRSAAIAEKVPEIDLIIDGHSHTVLKEKGLVNGVTIVQTGSSLQNVGEIKIDLTKKGTDAISYKLISKEEVKELAPNDKITALITNIKNGQNKITEEVIGTTPIKLDGEKSQVRTSETNLARLITDSMLWKTNADMAITNGGGIRASIDEGQITIGEVITVLPFGNYVITKELTGQEIKDTLEYGYSFAPNEAGSYAQIGGITRTLDLTKPVGQRVSNIKFKNGKKFNLKSKYIVATNDFMAVGGDGYSKFKEKKELANFPGLDEILVEYIKTKGITTKQ